MSAPENQAPVAGRSRDAGDTLIEILIAVAILGIVSAALLGGFLTSISTSSVYESVANSDTVLRTAVDSVTTQMQQAPATAFGCSPAWSVASPPSVYVVTGLPTGYTAQVTQVNYWVNGTEQAGCSADAPQLISLTITYSSGRSTATNRATFLVDDPDAPPVQSYGSAYQLVFLSTGGPSNATAGSAIPQQPLVAIEDNSNPPRIVTTDLSPVTLSITSGSGTPGALLANCTGSEFYGVVNFKGCEIDTAGSGYTLTATDSGLPQPTAISRAFTVNPGPATNFLFTSWPVNQGSPPLAGTSQQPFAEQPTVTLRDAYGNTATTTTATIDLAITSGTGASGATLSCTSTSSLTTTNGVAAFQGCNIDKAASGYTLTATDGSGSLASAVTQPFNIGPGSPIKLVFTTEPAGSAGSAPGYNGTITGGSAFPTQPVVTIEDAAGNTVTSNNSAVTLSITSNTGTSGAGLSCTNNTVTASSGVATFSGCAINLSGSGYTLTAQDSSLTSGISAPAFNVSVGPPAQLAFTTEPGGSPLTAGSAFPTQPVVAVEDAGGNTVTTGTGSNAAITVAINSGTGTLTCSNNTVTASSGVATFSGCAINKTGSFTLKANGDSLPAATSSPAFTVSAGPPAQLAFTTEPGGATAGSAFSSQPAVTVEDAEGNPVPNSPVALTINSGSGTLTCSNNTVATSSSGVASFSNCSINKTGSFTLKATDGSATANSSAFTVSAGPPAQLTFSTEPSGSNTAGTAFSTQPAVTVEDAEGNLVPNSSVTLSITSGATLTCTSNTVTTNSSGVAAFSGCQTTTAGSGYTLKATDGSVNATSSTFTVAAGTASQLAFNPNPPAGAAKNTYFGISVAVEDAYGNTVTSNSTAKVSLAIASGPSGATLTCSSNPVTASSGVATFSCKLSKSGSYTLTATNSNGSLVSATSSSFTIS